MSDSLKKIGRHSIELLQLFPSKIPPDKPKHCTRCMSDEANIAREAKCDIDHEHDEDLIRHRMSSCIEINPEIGEECHTKSRNPDREMPWNEEPERCRYK